jgi:single-strand DNA-binding protein
MFSLNRAQIVGNLTRDPELRSTPNGQSVCSFGVATNRRWKDKDGNNQDSTEFHDIVAWGKLAEIVSQILHKGNKLYIEGRLQTQRWEGQDGSKRNKTEIIMENFIALTPKGATEEHHSDTQAPTIEDFPSEKAETNKETPKPAKKEDTEPADEINLDDIPF